MKVVSQYHKWVIACLIALFCFSLRPCNASGQDDPAISGRILVGVRNEPPFEIKTADGQWEGLGIELWRMIARDLALEYEFQEYKSIRQIHDAIENR